MFYNKKEHKLKKLINFSGVEGLLEQASKWESTGEYAKAVDSYLRIMPSNTIEKETAYKCWMKVYRYLFFE